MSKIVAFPLHKKPDYARRGADFDDSVTAVEPDTKPGDIGIVAGVSNMTRTTIPITFGEGTSAPVIGKVIRLVADRDRSELWAIGELNGAAQTRLQSIQQHHAVPYYKGTAHGVLCLARVGIVPQATARCDQDSLMAPLGANFSEGESSDVGRSLSAASTGETREQDLMTAIRSIPSMDRVEVTRLFSEITSAGF